VTSIEALDFAVARLRLDRRHFVDPSTHDAALETLQALRELIAERQETPS
jgi:hypothetical protein